MSAIDYTYSDHQLIQLLAKGDQNAFDRLYERYFAPVFNYAYQKTGDRFLAQEVVQELFINLWQQRERLLITGAVNAYIFTAAKHLIIDQYRREATRTRHTDTFSNRQELTSNQTEEQIWADDLQQTYEELLRQLPDRCRQVFVLSRQGLANREIARQLGIAEKTVEQHITKALRLLHQHLPKHLLTLLLMALYEY